MTDAFGPLAAALADRYRVERELGAGGMATVYLARDERHGRPVAVKVLRPELAAALGAERFLREITVTAQLDHPHILPLLDSGEAAGFLYYVMPYVEGESLRDRLDREKQLPLDDAVQIAREVADALSYAHSRGVIHRDIKPENILLSGGHARVADFGIARAIDEAGGEHLTATGLAVGTPAYMSPEQAAGSRDLDGRSDLYGLACVLYEMLAGQPPFTGPTAESLVRQHLTAEPRAVTDVRPAVPTALAGILQRALAKNPADRFSPVAQFADALAARVEPAARPQRRTPRWILPVAGALVVVLLAAVLAALLLRRPAPALTVGATTQLTLDPGLEVDPAISPDGELVAYAAGPPTAMQIYVRRLSGGRAIALTADSTRNHRWPRWTADGAEVAFQADSTIYAAPALGGPIRPLARLPSDTIFGFDLSPDGGRLAYVLGVPTRIWVQTLPGGTPEPVSAPAPDAHSVAWSPDGRRLAWVDGNFPFVFGTIWFANEAPSAIVVAEADGGARQVITPAAGQLNVSPAWGPDGRLLFWISSRGGARDVWYTRLSGRGTPVGEPRQLTTGLGAHGISIDAAGTRLAYSVLVSPSNVWAIDIPRRAPVSIREARAVTTGNQTIEGLDVSPDGRWLVFDSNRGGDYDIYRMPLAGGEIARLTTDPAGDHMPRFSPDGRTIVFHSLRAGQRDLYTMATDGTGETRRTDDPGWDLDADWAGSDALVYGHWAGDTIRLQRLTLADGAVTPLPYGEYVRATADGGTLCYIEPARGLWTYEIASGTARLLVASERERDGPQYCAWAPDGRTVYYLSSGPPRWGIWAIPREGGTPRLLVDFDDPARQHTRYGFTTDGRRFYFTLGSHESDVWVMEVSGER